MCLFVLIAAPDPCPPAPPPHPLPHLTPLPKATEMKKQVADMQTRPPGPASICPSAKKQVHEISYQFVRTVHPSISHTGNCVQLCTHF